MELLWGRLTLAQTDRERAKAVCTVEKGKAVPWKVLRRQLVAEVTQVAPRVESDRPADDQRAGRTDHHIDIDRVCSKQVQRLGDCCCKPGGKGSAWHREGHAGANGVLEERAPAVRQDFDALSLEGILDVSFGHGRFERAQARQQVAEGRVATLVLVQEPRGVDEDGCSGDSVLNGGGRDVGDG
eukprot:scaffold74377_cov42-Prasinocladus_malaysianus.AAC.2